MATPRVQRWNEALFGFAKRQHGVVARGQLLDVGFTELGVRVPLVVVSPYAKRHFVSHARHEHTSILRFIETLFNVPALTARDANSDAMLDLFDFCNPQMTVDAPPAAGTGGCK